MSNRLIRAAPPTRLSICVSLAPLPKRLVLFAPPSLMSWPQGSAIGIVIRTGDRTVIGQIAGQASDTENQPSSLQVELMRFVKFIAVIAFSTAAVFFAIGLGRLKGQNVLYLIINGAALLFCFGLLTRLFVSQGSSSPSLPLSRRGSRPPSLPCSLWSPADSRRTMCSARSSLLSRRLDRPQ